MPVPAGKFLIALLNKEINARPGNSKPAIFAGLSTELSARGRYKKIGVIRFNYAGSAKYINQCYPLFNHITFLDTGRKPC
jgi:hypothetical protein